MDDETLTRLFWCLAFAIAIGAACTLTAYLVNRLRKRELGAIIGGIKRLSRGELYARFKACGAVRSDVTIALNEMAESLSSRIRLIEGQRNELDSVLENLHPGIIIVDQQGSVLRLNKSAAVLLGVQREQSISKSIEEVLRNIYLQQFVKRALLEDEPIEAEVLLYSDVERNLQIYSSALRGVDGVRTGSLVVLSDVTHLKKLESVRRDFVANVSHELKTPITSIKGFVETLLDGALNEKDEAKRFLNIISRQAERLNAIVEDLLSLARMEHGDTRQELAKDLTPVIQVISSALQSCELKARAKNVRLKVDCVEGIQSEFNESLIEQALINLIDNAIKYSAPESEVKIIVKDEDSALKISVVDQGVGIEPMHLARVFERFYRVDSARSRQQGGTGLGLAIVKHIALLHGGYTHGESVVGRGSTFTIVLPGEIRRIRHVA